ncbi:hypothetical protein Tco_1395190 [Tanacetum coccineum]
MYICGNNAEANGSASRQAQQTEPVVGQDGLGGSGTGAIIGLSAASGQGGAGGPGSPGGAGVGSQVSETKNADGKEMGDGIPTRSSAAGGAKSDNGKFPMVDEEDLTYKKLAPIAEEIILSSEVFLSIAAGTKVVQVDGEIRTQPASQPSTSSQVTVSETRNVDGREIGDGIPTQSSTAGGAGEWSFL